MPVATSGDVSIRYRVVSFDARGFGESDKPTAPEDYSVAAMVGDVLAVADACEAQSFHYLGWSLGAKVGWGLADQAQDRLASLALMGAEPEASDEDASAMIALSGDGMDAVGDAMAQMWDMPDWALEQQRQTSPSLFWPTRAQPDRIWLTSPASCGCRRFCCAAPMRGYTNRWLVRLGGKSSPSWSSTAPTTSPAFSASRHASVILMAKSPVGALRMATG